MCIYLETKFGARADILGVFVFIHKVPTGEPVISDLDMKDRSGNI